MEKLLIYLAVLSLSIQTLYAQTDRYAIVPKPVRLTEQSGSYTLPAKPTISVQSTNAEVRRIARMLADQLGKSTGMIPTVTTGNAAKGISFVSANGPKLGAEGYTLTVSPKQIVITAEQPQGFFYGVQSLMQLCLPPCLVQPK